MSAVNIKKITRSDLKLLIKEEIRRQGSIIESQVISINIEGATIDGVVHDDPQRILNWANKEGVSEELLQNLELPMAILKNTFVPEEKRGQGIGNRLIEDFMNQTAAAGAYDVVLIADLGQEQAAGFSLVDWYEGYGFNVVGKDGAGNSVMVLDQ